MSDYDVRREAEKLFGNLVGCYAQRDAELGEIRAALLRAREDKRQQCEGCVPTTWMDGLLSGPHSGNLPLTGPDVEKLLRALKARIAALKEQP